MNSLYVDDFLCTVYTEQEAVNLSRDISALCVRGGFQITKWMSNSRTVLESIPEHHRSTGFVDLNLDSLPTKRAIGISWDVQRDLL